MKWTMSMCFAMAVAGCGYGQTKMVATCPPTGCGNDYAAAAPTPVKKVDNSRPADTDLPASQTPAVEAMPQTPLPAPLPDRALPPPVVPPNVP
jgi:hypothetical protein